MEYDTPALPSLVRNSEIDLFVPAVEIDNVQDITTFISSTELELLNEFRANIPEDNLYSLRADQDHSSLDVVFLARHHEVPTRLVDVTFDPLVALFFACEEHDGLDGWIYLYSTTPYHVREEHLPERYDQAYDIVLQQIQQQNNLQSFMNITFLYRRPFANERVANQKGAFVWRLNPYESLQGGTLVIRINGDAKSQIMEQLALLNISRETLGLDL
jgi:hypothetical protein